MNIKSYINDNVIYKPPVMQEDDSCYDGSGDGSGACYSDGTGYGSGHGAGDGLNNGRGDSNFVLRAGAENLHDSSDYGSGYGAGRGYSDGSGDGSGYGSENSNYGYEYGKKGRLRRNSSYGYAIDVIFVIMVMYTVKVTFDAIQAMVMQ